MSNDRDAQVSAGTSAPGGPSSAPNGFVSLTMEVLGFGRGLTIGALLFIGALLTTGVVLFVRSAPPSTITITSGPEGSIFHTNAFRYAAVLARYRVKLKIVTSAGSQENLQRLTDPAVRVDVGFVQGGVTNEAMDKVDSLGSLSYQPLLVFYRGAPLDMLSGLAGKRIAVGKVGSGTHSLALTLLAANGIKPGGTNTLLELEATDSSKALVEGKVDAVFLMGEDAPAATLRDMMRAQDVHLLSFKQAVAYTRRMSYLSVLELPQGAIDFGRNLPPQDVHLLGPTVELIARQKLHPALSDLLLEAAREVHGRASLFQRKSEFPAPLEHDFRLSPEALRFYKSGKSFFYRFLPFWLASLTSRVVVVFVPMIVVLIPLLRSLPTFYRWRIRSRIFRWYRALLAVEREHFSGSPRERLEKRLDEIEQAVNRMKVPASFADLFYGLRGHIGFVRDLVHNRGKS